MNRFDELLMTDFDGGTGVGVDDVIYDGLDDDRHLSRVPGLLDLMRGPSGDVQHRYLACLALTTWGESDGYRAVVEAAGDPKNSPWRGASIDRMYSVDDTFAHLLTAVDDSDDISADKGTVEDRRAAMLALVRIADSEYFDGKLGYSLSGQDGISMLPEIGSTVERGVEALRREEHLGFDLPAQLIDLASVVAPVDDAASVELARGVLEVASHQRALVHAVAIVQRGKGDTSREFGEYLITVGGEPLRKSVNEALHG